MVSKYDIPDIIPAEDSTPAQSLQGAAIRGWYMVVKGYIGALYLEKPASTPEEIYASDSYQQMTLVMLVSKMSARRIANAFYDSIQLNSPPEEQKAMKADLDSIFSVVDGSMKQGEQAVFEYLPEQGVRTEIAGEEPVNRVPGNRFRKEFCFR